MEQARTFEESLDYFIRRVIAYKNFIEGYLAYYEGYAKSYFQEIVHFEESKRTEYYRNMTQFAELNFKIHYLNEAEWQQMENHTKVGYIFILAHNFLVMAFDHLYSSNATFSQKTLFAATKNSKIKDNISKWGNDLDEQRKHLNRCYNELTDPPIASRKAVFVPYIGSDWKCKMYIQSWGAYTFLRKKESKQTLSQSVGVTDDGAFWIGNFFPKLLNWEMDQVTSNWAKKKPRAVKISGKKHLNSRKLHLSASTLLLNPTILLRNQKALLLNPTILLRNQKALLLLNPTAQSDRN